MKKKLVSLLMMACMMLTPVQSFGAVLHSIRETQTITKGATFIKDQLLTDAGWQDVYVLQLNLNDSNLEVRPISSSKYDAKETILEMAKQTGALAAINADFFSMDSNAPSFGPMISAGQVIQAYSNRYTDIGSKKNMGTVLIDENNTIRMNYFDMAVNLHSSQGKIGEAFSYNKVPVSVTLPIVIDQYYMKTTAELMAKQPNLYSIVVEDNTVIYQGLKGEVVAIPENGFVLVMDETNAGTYRAAFPIGEKLSVETTVHLGNELMTSIENIKLGIGGGGFLMKNGQTYTESTHIVSGNTRNPRSIIATTSTPNEILLIAVDGRGTSIGATHNEMIQILKRYGVKDAMYLDGGGSTTVVAREEGQTSVTLQNAPSGGSQRKVMNGLGVFSTQAPGAVKELVLQPALKRTFVGESVALNVRAVDSNKNPVPITTQSVVFEVIGVEGKVVGSTFYPESEGEALILARLGDVQVAESIYVSKAPVGLMIEPSVLTMNAGETKNIQAFGIDQGGYKIPVSTDRLIWDNTGLNVIGDRGQIIASVTGTTTLTAQYGDSKATAKTSVIIGDQVQAIESFETVVPSWGGNTSHVSGMVQPATDIKFHGSRSIKMTYTFEKSTNKQVAYTVFDTPIMIPNDAYSFNMWVNGRKQGDTLKIEVVDAKGKSHYIKLADSIDFEGWKYLSAPLGEDIAMPAKVTKIYAYAQSVAEKRTSALYFDHVSITRGDRNRQGTASRTDYTFDPLYKTKLDAPVGDQYTINVIGPTISKSLTLGAKNIEAISAKLLRQSKAVFMASTNNAQLILGNQLLGSPNAFLSNRVGNTQVINLATDKGGLRLTDASQWDALKNTLEETTANHVILIMSHNPLTQFTDQREGRALHEYLVAYREKTGRPIFVVTPGGVENEMRLEDSIRYIRTPGIVSPTDALEKATFVQFKAVGNMLYYTFENMF